MKEKSSIINTQQIYNQSTLQFQFIIRVIGTIVGLLLINVSTYHNNVIMVYGVAISFLVISILVRFTNIKDNVRIQKINLYLDVLVISVLIVFRGGLRSDFFLGYYIILGYVLLLRDAKLLLRISVWIIILFSLVSILFTPEAQFSFGRLIIRETLLMGTVFCLFNYSRMLNKEMSLRIQATDLALRDNLTKTYNRNILMNVDEMLLKESINVFIVLLDIDNFKMINDTFGHIYGDQVLVSLGSLLNQTIPNEDIVIRYGGEEFLILLQDMTEKQVSHMIESIKTQFNQMTHDWYTLENELSFSAGIIKKKDSESFSSGIDRADKKLYQAKSEGRNKVIM